MNRIFTAALLLLTLAAPAALADEVTIDVTLDAITYLDENFDTQTGSYQLVGQSAFLQFRSQSSTSGGLTGVITPGATLTFTEVFPPPALSDYLTFAYFGLVEILDVNGGLFADTSLIVAFRPGIAEGNFIDNTNGSIFSNPLPHTASALVTALSTVNDSPEFFDLMDRVSNNPLRAQGAIGVPPIGQLGETLDLIAFIGGANRDEGVKIGTISITVIPEPASLALLAAGSLLILRRRRAA